MGRQRPTDTRSEAQRRLQEAQNRAQQNDDPQANARTDAQSTAGNTQLRRPPVAAQETSETTQIPPEQTMATLAPPPGADAGEPTPVEPVIAQPAEFVGESAQTGGDSDPLPPSSTGGAIDGIRGSALSGRIDRLRDTFDQRVVIERPVADTSTVTVGSGSTTGSQQAEQSVSEAVFDDAAGIDTQLPRVEPVPAGDSSTEPTGPTEADKQFAELAREYLAATGRYDNVESMTYEQLNDALNTEALRDQLGITHDVPQSQEQLETYAGVVAEELWQETWDGARSSLVTSGHFTAEEVAAMSNEEVITALGVLQRNEGWIYEASRERQLDDQTSSVIEGGSIRLVNTGTGAPSGGSTAEESSTPSGGSTSESDSGSGGSSQDGTNNSSSDDNDDDDDDDGNQSQSTPAATEDTSSGEDGEQSEEGAGEGTSATTPNPEAPVSSNPADRAAFLESPVGRGDLALTGRAVEMGRGGGLVEPGESDLGRAEWIQSRVAAQENATLLRGVETAKSGGHTDPAEHESPRGLSDIDELKVRGGGYTDPVDDPASPPPDEGNPLFPVSPGGVGPLGNLANLELQTGLLANLDASLQIEDVEELADGLG